MVLRVQNSEKAQCNKAPYRPVHTGPAAPAKIGRRQLISAVDVDFGCRRSISTVNGRLKKKKGKKKRKRRMKKQYLTAVLACALTVRPRRPWDISRAVATHGLPARRRRPHNPRATIVSTRGDETSPRGETKRLLALGERPRQHSQSKKGTVGLGKMSCDCLHTYSCH
ncbi:hypothetical protein BHE74_00020191 [Ensete ventricosum]|nr:hypothetical protein BHE74_00020191 [Ensete ventricosum]